MCVGFGRGLWSFGAFVDDIDGYLCDVGFAPPSLMNVLFAIDIIVLAPKLAVIRLEASTISFN